MLIIGRANSPTTITKLRPIGGVRLSVYESPSQTAKPS
jgi:hypothetical protein